MPGSQSTVWTTVVRALAGSSYRYVGGDYPHSVMVRSLTDRKEMRIELDPAGPDSMHVLLTGRQYAGPADRAGVILAAPEAWPVILQRDSAAKLLRSMADRLLATLTPPPVSTSPSVAVIRDSVVEDPFKLPQVPPRDLPGGRTGFCRTNAVEPHGVAIVDVVQLSDWCETPPGITTDFAGNTYVLQDPSTVPVGGTLEVCSISEIPAGFDLVEWFTDSTRCPYDRLWEWKGEPNMKRIRRR